MLYEGYTDERAMMRRIKQADPFQREAPLHSDSWKALWQQINCDMCGSTENLNLMPCTDHWHIYCLNCITEGLKVQ